jgi:hypothetical protein
MRLWRSAVVALTATVAIAAWSSSALAVDARCGRLRGTAVFAIEAARVRCPEARTIATLHERSVKRRGACALTKLFCTLRRYVCFAKIGIGRSPDAIVLCRVRGREDTKVQFRYDHRKIRLPRPPQTPGTGPEA